MKHVKFVKWFGPYQAGQWATFPEDEAKRLVTSGKAVWHDPDKTAEAPPKRSSTTSKMVSK